MKASPECYACLFSQAAKTARALDLSSRITWRIIKQVSLHLSQASHDVCPPELGRDVYRIISDIAKVKDPYRIIKKKCTRQALSLYGELKQLVRTAEDPLKTAVKTAIAGNVIDFGTAGDFDLKKDVEDVLTQEIALNAYQAFKKRLDRASQILYIADNAGETVFDRILIEELGKPVIYVVRESPIINDATREDAEDAGLDEVASIISSGSSVPGLDLKTCRPAFLNLYRSADMIISKGQGNYECLSEENRPIFFLLKVKCAVVARDLGVEEGCIVLLEAPNYRGGR